MAQLFIEPLARVFTNTGSVGAGYKYYFYTTGTTTPINSYTTSDLSVANSYPVVADANGRFGPIWLSNLATTKVVLKDASDNVIETQDPVGSTSATTSLNDLDVRPDSYWGLTTGTTSAYVLTANPSIQAYSNVQSFTFQAHIANIINPTIAISGLSALNLKKYTGQGTKVGLQAGDLQPTQRYSALCDGVDIVVLNPRSLPLNIGTAPTLTIATGIVTATNVGGNYLIDTEGAGATDDLDTISGGNDGQIITIGIVADARNVVLKHNTGNIFNPAQNDITLDVTTDKIELLYSSTLSKWVVLNLAYKNAFASTKAATGSQNIAGGAVLKWGTTTTTTGNQTHTFAEAFPTACTVVYMYNNAAAAYREFEILINGAASFDFEVITAAATDPRFFAIGY